MTPYFYQEQEKFYLSVDCLILGFRDDKLYLLITKRIFEPLKGQDSLMGGFIRVDENIDEAATRVLSEYTGIENIYMEQVGAYGEVGRDIGERVISIAYYALIDMQTFDDELCETHNARWVELEKVNELVFDHNRILSDTLNILKKKAATQPVGFNLLPEKFTLPQLQTLYEAIYQRPLDKRNFRKRILEMDILKKHADKDKSSSKRGAYYYSFDQEKYGLLLKKGYFFSL
ncbi:NUDIX hydrolase [Viscerimonas tarda]